MVLHGSWQGKNSRAQRSAKRSQVWSSGASSKAAPRRPGSASSLDLPAQASASTDPSPGLPAQSSTLASTDPSPGLPVFLNAAPGSDSEDDNSGIVMVSVPGGDIGKVTFSSSSLTQLFMNRMPPPIVRAELLSTYDSGVVYMQWANEAQFNDATLRQFLEKWVQEELE